MQHNPFVQIGVPQLLLGFILAAAPGAMAQEDPAEASIAPVRNEPYFDLAATVAEDASPYALAAESRFEQNGFTFKTVDHPLAPAVNPIGRRVTRLQGINDRGTAIGWYLLPGNRWNSFAYRKGIFTPISGPAGALSTQVTGINAAGTIVGNSSVGCFILEKGNYTSLAHPLAAGRTTSLDAINASGDVVGSYRDINRQTHYFVLSKGEFTEIFLPPGFRFFFPLFGINAAGVVAGSIFDQQNVAYGFTLDKGEYTTFIHPLTVPEPGSICTGINASGTLVGYLFNPADRRYHGYVLCNGVFTTVDPPQFTGVQSEAHGINDSGTIVGMFSEASRPGTPLVGSIHGYIAEPNAE